MTDEERDVDLRELRMLDPARAPRPDAGRERAAQGLLDDILQTPQSGSSAKGPDRTTRRSGRRRWVAVGAAAAAVAVGLVVVSPWSAPEEAFATWTAAPREVPAESVDELGEQCTTRAAREGLGQEAVIAEERGRVAFVVTGTPYSVGHCLLVDGEMYTSGSAGPRVRGQHPEVAPTEVQTYMAAGGDAGDDAYTAIIGRTGQDVVGVEVPPPRAGDRARRITGRRTARVRHRDRRERILRRLVARHQPRLRAHHPPSRRKRHTERPGLSTMTTNRPEPRGRVLPGYELNLRGVEPHTDAPPVPHVPLADRLPDNFRGREQVAGRLRHA